MTITASVYHQITSYSRHRMSGHGLDWANQPSVHKKYACVTFHHLPSPEKLPHVSLCEATAPGDESNCQRSVTINRLSNILAHAYGVTGRTQSGGKTIFYRSAPSAGALYPVELYVAVEKMDGFSKGLYHYDSESHGMHQLRSEHVAAYADQCIELDSLDTPSDIFFFLTALYFRSAWKYKSRAFRYLLLDTGHVLENLLMALQAEGLSATVHYDIRTDKSDRLLGCDPKRETCFACVRITGNSKPSRKSRDDITPLPQNIRDTGRVSLKEVFYEEIEQISFASSQPPPATTDFPKMVECLGLSTAGWQPIEPVKSPAVFDFSNAVIRRRSRRNYIQHELSRETFFGFLQYMTTVSGRWRPKTPPFGSCIATGLLVQNVEGVEPGFYMCDFLNNRWGRIRTGRFQASMANVCLDQHWLQNAAVHVCFLANLQTVDKTWGARGYRYAMLDAGRLGEIVYLAATAFGLGCCGIGALYDDEAKSLLGLNDNSALLYLLAAGPVRSV